MKILDRYLSGQILGTVIWAVSLLTMILVLGNVLRDLLSLLLRHQVPVPPILSFFASFLSSSFFASVSGATCTLHQFRKLGCALRLSTSRRMIHSPCLEVTK